MKNRILLNLIFLAFISWILPALSETKELTISEFQKINPKKGAFKILGYIAKQYSCPPCSQDRQCKPCMRNNILVSSNSERLLSYPNSGEYLIIFAEYPEKLSQNKSYYFNVEVLQGNSTGYKTNDLQLISALENN